MRTRVKVCCIRSLEEARLAIALGADALGLVAEMPSGPGPIPDATIAAIAAACPPAVATFLLTSRTAPEAVVAHVTLCRTNVVQLVDDVSHGTYCALRAACPAVRIVQVIHVEDERAIATALRVAPEVDAILLDSGRPGAAVKELGGTGRTHDWSVSRRIVETVSVPVFLAGGLNVSNVGEAIAVVSPFGVDLCTGVRTDGALDGEKLKAFLGEVQRADTRAQRRAT